MLEHYRTRIEAALHRRLPASEEQLSKAMRYSTSNGGKRLRAALVYACGADFNCTPDMLDNAACAVECIHAYSLIHDDLPAMDAADLRRGKASCHQAFDEATAILAGDALNTLAFSLLTTSTLPDRIRLAQIKRLANAAGWAGMVGGQSRDIAATGHTLSLTVLQKIHRDKTGALIDACLHLGALPSASYERYRDTLEALGEEVGLAYQIIDDILDFTADTATLGKTAGKDLVQAKNTYISQLGLEGSRQAIRRHRTRAGDLLARLPGGAVHLGEIIEQLFSRCC